MNNPGLLERIKQLGFSEYEARCYLALFERESLAVSEVSRLAGIPRSNAYEAMGRLMAKGLVVSIPGKMKRYSVSDPWVLREKYMETLNTSMETELDNLEQRRKEILDMKIREMLDKKKAIQENIDNVAAELESMFKGSRSDVSPLDYLEVIKDPLQTLHRYVGLISEAAREILVFSKPPYSFSNKKQEGEQDDIVYKALRRGVEVKSIYEITNENEKSRLAVKLPLWVRHGEKIRVAEDLPIKLAVFDEKTIILPLEDPVQGVSSLTSLIAGHHALARSMRVLFECYWEKAKEVRDIFPQAKIDAKSAKRAKAKKDRGRAGKS